MGILSSNHALSPNFITLGASFLHFLPTKPFSLCAPAGPMEREKEKDRSRREGKSIKPGLQPLGHFCNEPPPAPISLLSYFTAGYLFPLLSLSPGTGVRRDPHTCVGVRLVSSGPSYPSLVISWASWDLLGHLSRENRQSGHMQNKKNGNVMQQAH